MVRNIIIVGGQRCGSTMLYSNLLNAHNTKGAAQKNGEPKFFLGPEARSSTESYLDIVFNNHPKDVALIEKSTSYYENPKALRKIKATLPNCSIVLIIRDPIKRAVSNYNFSVDNRLEHRSLIEALTSAQTPTYDSKISVSPFAYKERGLYSNHIQSIYENFDKSQVHIVVFEELIASPDVFFGLVNALGLEHCGTFLPALNRNESSGEKIKVDQELHKFLLDYFKSDVLRVFSLIGRNIDKWEYILGGAKH